MNHCCPLATPDLPGSAVAPDTPAARHPAGGLARLLNRIRFVSVDLTDSIFATAPTQLETLRANADRLGYVDRPEKPRMMPWRFI